MFNYLFFLLFFVSSTLFAGSSCQLMIDKPMHFKENLGAMNLSNIGKNSFWVDESSIFKKYVFNTDDLYEVADKKGSRYFRLNARAYDHQGTNKTFIYDLAYALNIKPVAGKHVIKSYTTERKSFFGKTLDTIGDSITWWQYGRFLRCMMRDKGLQYDFTGAHYDVFGFRHDGMGGNTSTDVLKRIDEIAIADTYFILIGTNDYATLTPYQTVANIELIAKKLKFKNFEAKIYISTLLPRTDIQNSNVQAINKLLMSSSAFCSNCFIIDVGRAFSALPNWPSLLIDSIHPNYNGYIALGTILSGLIN